MSMTAVRLETKRSSTDFDSNDESIEISSADDDDDWSITLGRIESLAKFCLAATSCTNACISDKMSEQVGKISSTLLKGSINI